MLQRYLEEHFIIVRTHTFSRPQLLAPLVGKSNTPRTDFGCYVREQHAAKDLYSSNSKPIGVQIFRYKYILGV